MHPSLPLQEAKHSYFTSSTTPALALPLATEIALVHFDLTTHQLGRFGLQHRKPTSRASRLACGPATRRLGAGVKQDRCVAIHTRNPGRRSRRHTCAEILDQFFMYTTPQAAPSPISNHLKQTAFLSYLC
jgi:hypothetical protein